METKLQHEEAEEKKKKKKVKFMVPKVRELSAIYLLFLKKCIPRHMKAEK